MQLLKSENALHVPRGKAAKYILLYGWQKVKCRENVYNGEYGHIFINS